MTAQPSTIPLADQIAELERELAFRREKYPKLVRNGAFTAESTELKLRRLEAAIATLKGMRAWPNR